MKSARQWNFALTSSALYAIGGAIWILTSDRLLSRLFGPATFVLLSSYKGLAFVAVTSALLFVALRRAAERGAAPETEERTRGSALPLVLLATAASILIAGSALVFYRSVAESLARNAISQARAMVDLKTRDLGRWLGAQQANVSLLAADATTQAVDNASLCAARIARRRGRTCGARPWPLASPAPISSMRRDVR